MTMVVVSLMEISYVLRRGPKINGFPFRLPIAIDGLPLMADGNVMTPGESTMNLSSKEKSELRRAAQLIKPAVRVGKKGVTPNLIDELNTALRSDALVKVDFRWPQKAIADLEQEIESRTGAASVGGVGKRRSFFKKAPSEPAEA